MINLILTQGLPIAAFLGSIYWLALPASTKQLRSYIQPAMRDVSELRSYRLEASE